MSVAVDDAAGSAKTISNDITSVQWTQPSEVQDITGVDLSAMERLSLLADFTVTLQGVTNFTADKSHDVFKNVGCTMVTRTVTLTHSGQILANEVLFNDYEMQRAANGARTWQAPGQLNSTIVPVWTT